MEVLEEDPSLASVGLKNLLFATDFSAASQAALPFVAAIARRYNSKVHLAHVVMPETYPLLLPPETMAAAFEQLTYDAEHKLQALVTSEQFQGIQPEMLLEQGPLGAAIAGMLKEHKIDLIVIGTHGRRGLKRFLLGSIAEDIFRNSTCPVLTVGPHVRPAAQPELKFRRILCPTNLSERSFAALPYAISLGMEYSAQLTLLHVAPDGTPAKSDRTLLRVEIERAMQRLIPAEVRPSLNFEKVVEFGNPAEAIVTFAKDHQVDLIVMGARQADALVTHMEENTAYRVVTEVDCPVMTVPVRRLNRH